MCIQKINKNLKQLQNYGKNLKWQLIFHSASLRLSGKTCFCEDFRYRGTFLHGELQSKLGYDIFSFNQETNFEEGIHSITVNGISCYFYLWKTTSIDSNIIPWRGLLVIQTDLESVKYAQECYIENRNLI